MQTVNVTYHQEKAGWYARSTDVPRFFATGDTREEVQQEVHKYLPLVLGEFVEEFHETDAPVAA